MAKANQKQRPRTFPAGSVAMTPEERRVGHAIAPFDKAIKDMDQKWGIDRLSSLVSPDTAARYGKLVADFNAALAANDPDKAIGLARVGIRALAAMNAEAEAAGQQPCRLWEYDLDGFHFAIIEDNRRWQEIKANRPELLIFTMREAALALQMFHDSAGGLLAEAKRIFSGAEAVAVRPKQTTPERNPEDPIPS